jgi:hypothetical protein
MTFCAKSGRRGNTRRVILAASAKSSKCLRKLLTTPTHVALLRTDPVVRCDLSRPCQTCRDREHPELCSYHPPNKKQNGEKSLPASLIKHDDAVAGATSGAGHVTLSRGEFDMICNKLNNLETSLAELRQEVWRNAQGRAGETQDPPLASMVNGVRELAQHAVPQATAAAAAAAAAAESHGDGMQQYRRHTEIHGLHTSNEAVSDVLRF